MATSSTSRWPSTAAAGITATSSVSDYSPPMPSAGSKACASRPRAPPRPRKRWPSRTAEALSNDTGVNVDQEMSLLLDLEHSYQASARLIKAVDDMLAALLDARWDKP